MPHGQRTKTLKKKQYCNKFNKDFKKWSTSKKIFKKIIDIKISVGFLRKLDNLNLKFKQKNKEKITNKKLSPVTMEAANSQDLHSESLRTRRAADGVSSSLSTKAEDQSSHIKDHQAECNFALAQPFVLLRTSIDW